MITWPTVKKDSRILSSSTNPKDFRWLVCFFIIMVCATRVCKCSEDISTNHNTGRYKKQAEANSSHRRSVLSSNESVHRKTCDKGQRLNVTSQICDPCAYNSFNPVDNHTYEDCTECRLNEPNSKQIELWPGNTTHAPKFGCTEGYFIEGYTVSKIYCEFVDCGKCGNCSELSIKKYEGQKCANNSDTVCCEEPDMVVEPGSRKCTRKTTTPTTTTTANTISTAVEIRCDKNYYLDDRNNTCQPCPPYTYVDTDNHKIQSCFNCSGVTRQDMPSGCRSGQETGSKDESSLNDGEIAGIIGGILGLLLLLVLLIIVLVRKGKCKRATLNECCRTQCGSTIEEATGGNASTTTRKAPSAAINGPHMEFQTVEKTEQTSMLTSSNGANNNNYTGTEDEES